MSHEIEVDGAPGMTELKQELARIDESRFGRYARFVLAALSSLPWVGGLIGASATREVLEDESDLIRPVLGLEPFVVLKG